MPSESLLSSWKGQTRSPLVTNRLLEASTTVDYDGARRQTAVWTSFCIATTGGETERRLVVYSGFLSLRKAPKGKLLLPSLETVTPGEICKLVVSRLLR